MFSKTVIRVVAVIMAVLMLLGAFGAVISAFALGEGIENTATPQTGQPSSYVPMIVGGIALVAAIICVILSKKSKKTVNESVDKDYINEDDVEKGLNFFTSRKEDTFIEKPEESLKEDTE